MSQQQAGTFSCIRCQKSSEAVPLQCQQKPTACLRTPGLHLQYLTQITLSEQEKPKLWMKEMLALLTRTASEMYEGSYFFKE